MFALRKYTLQKVGSIGVCITTSVDTVKLKLWDWFLSLHLAAVPAGQDPKVWWEVRRLHKWTFKRLLPEDGEEAVFYPEHVCLNRFK